MKIGLGCKGYGIEGFLVSRFLFRVSGTELVLLGSGFLFRD